ncbi:hypothetical protein BpHYR1_041807 [Brachionus plicatilis]|uniref:Uncharacterized protein n=1 Tax=Brachionus plicatilis TaxID=10195 RepID=A0A3M7RAX4_BRAPC|nr:hypothetical protein BpHYR1_041807 [Brachionus plicatilis]
MENGFQSDEIKKWKGTERSFYSLYGLGCKASIASPKLISFLFKQYCRQNLLLKRFMGPKKFTHVTPLYEAVNLESVRKIYYKHKICFLEQLLRCPLCKQVYYNIRSNNGLIDSVKFVLEKISYSLEMNNGFFCLT